MTQDTVDDRGVLARVSATLGRMLGKHDVGKHDLGKQDLGEGGLGKHHDGVAPGIIDLARRSRVLADRMLGVLDRIERDEEDPDRLAQLFELDQLAARMRRYDENLLTLAGAEPGPRRRADTSLVDVLRAGQSEVEHYDRVDIGAVDDELAVAAAAVDDVVRLVAELLDNATAFSEPATRVVVEGRREGDGALITIADTGAGVAAGDLPTLNTLLADPAATADRLGLVMVARLAGRHGIRVLLRCEEGTTGSASPPSPPTGGTVAEVLLPAELLTAAPSPAWLTGDLPTPRYVPKAPDAPLDEQVRTVLAGRIDHEADGDLAIRAGSAVVYVRVKQNPPLVEVFSPVLTEIAPSEPLYARLGELTHRMQIGRLYHAEDTVWASVPVFGRNLQAAHLLLAAQVMTGLADELDDRLHDEFGGKRYGDRAGVKPE